LLGVIQLAAGTGILVQDVVDVLEGLFKHGGLLIPWRGRLNGSAGGIMLFCAGRRTQRVLMICAGRLARERG